MKLLSFLSVVFLAIPLWAFQGVYSCILFDEGTHLTNIHCSENEILVDLQLNKVPGEGRCTAEEINVRVNLMGSATMIFVAEPHMTPADADFAERNYMQYLGQKKATIYCQLK